MVTPMQLLSHWRNGQAPLPMGAFINRWYQARLNFGTKPACPMPPTAPAILSCQIENPPLVHPYIVPTLRSLQCCGADTAWTVYWQEAHGVCRDASFSNPLGQLQFATEMLVGFNGTIPIGMSGYLWLRGLQACTTITIEAPSRLHNRCADQNQRPLIKKEEKECFAKIHARSCRTHNSSSPIASSSSQDVFIFPTLLRLRWWLQVRWWLCLLAWFHLGEERLWFCSGT